MPGSESSISPSRYGWPYLVAVAKEHRTTLIVAHVIAVAAVLAATVDNAASRRFGAAEAIEQVIAVDHAALLEFFQICDDVGKDIGLVRDRAGDYTH